MWVVRWGYGVGVGLSFDLFFSCRLQPPSAKVIGEIVPLQKDVGNIQDEWEFHIWVKLGRVRDLFFFTSSFGTSIRFISIKPPGMRIVDSKLKSLRSSSLTIVCLTSGEGSPGTSSEQVTGSSVIKVAFFSLHVMGLVRVINVKKYGRLRRM